MSLRHITYYSKKAFCEYEYEKINELSNFKCNLASHIRKIRDTTQFAFTCAKVIIGTLEQGVKYIQD